MRNGFAAIGAWLLLLVGALGSSAAIGQTSPVSNWSMNSKECILWHSYGSGRDSTRLGIKPSLTGDAIRIYIIYRGADVPNRWSEGTLRTDNAPDLPINFIDFPSTAAGQRFIKIDLPPETMARAAKSAKWIVSEAKLREFQFDLDGLPTVLPSQQRCVANQLAPLELDESRVVQPATSDFLKYFTSGSYPVLAARLGISGTTAMRILVGRDGKVLDCAVRQSSGNAVLDHVACEILLREVKFTPARDATGRPIASITPLSVAWQMDPERKKSANR